MAQPERRLAGVHAGAEQLELEGGAEGAQSRRCRRPDPEPALPDAGKGTVILAELVLERRQLRHAQGVEPVRVDLREVVPHVQHREAVDLHAGARYRLHGYRWLPRLLGSSGRCSETDHQNPHNESLHLTSPFPTRSRAVLSFAAVRRAGPFCDLPMLNGRCSFPTRARGLSPRRTDVRSCLFALSATRRGSVLSTECVHRRLGAGAMSHRSPAASRREGQREFAGAGRREPSISGIRQGNREPDRCPSVRVVVRGNASAVCLDNRAGN